MPQANRHERLDSGVSWLRGRGLRISDFRQLLPLRPRIRLRCCHPRRTLSRLEDSVQRRRQYLRVERYQTEIAIFRDDEFPGSTLIGGEERQTELKTLRNNTGRILRQRRDDREHARPVEVGKRFLL